VADGCVECNAEKREIKRLRGGPGGACKGCGIPGGLGCVCGRRRERKKEREKEKEKGKAGGRKRKAASQAATGKEAKDKDKDKDKKKPRKKQPSKFTAEEDQFCHDFISLWALRFPPRLRPRLEFKAYKSMRQSLLHKGHARRSVRKLRGRFQERAREIMTGGRGAGGAGARGGGGGSTPWSSSTRRTSGSSTS
jgi:hypothetical protein